MLKDRTIVVRTTRFEAMALNEMAEREGLRKSEMLRFILRNAAKSIGLWPPAPTAPTEEEHERQPA